MHAPTLLLAFVSIFSFACAQYSSLPRTGTFTISSFSAEPPSYTFPHVNTSTESVPLLYSAVTSKGAPLYYNSTTTSEKTTYTSISYATTQAYPTASSAVVAGTGTTPPIPLST